MNYLKQFYLLLFTCVITLTNTYSQESPFIGDWLGKLKISGIELRIAFHITSHDGIFVTKLDSPDQNSFGNPSYKTTVLNDSIIIDFPLMGVTYNGTYKDESIDGIFHQAGLDLPLILTSHSGELASPSRPQTPIVPLPYKEKEVKIKTTSEGVKLSGTLTIPTTKKPHPAVILISGSGPQDRNEEIMNHKPFMVLADHLTRQGVIVLRYDDRGVGKSTGDFSKGTSYDFADDAEAAFNYLIKQKGVDKTKVGIIGHSEGGIIAPIVASRNKAVSFIILMAGPSVPGSVIIPDQQELILIASGENADNIKKQVQLNENIVEYVSHNSDSPNLNQELSDLIEDWIKELGVEVPKSISIKNFSKQTAKSFTGDWMKTFITLSPAAYIKKVSCPILALYGENDLQVSVRANAEPMQQLLVSHENSSVHFFPKLNHLFQTSTTGSPSEYVLIEETLSPDFLDFVCSWIKQLK